MFRVVFLSIVRIMDNLCHFNVNQGHSPVGRHRFSASSCADQDFDLTAEICTEAFFEGIVGQSPAIRQVLHLIETVAPTDSTVLLLGETGTGKELVARAIHVRSRRAQRPLVNLNCAAIPGGLLESEVFGHERGAFTGAFTQKMGRLELADSGTLFLDEIGDIPLELQPKLLRVLQEREFERLGGTRTRSVNVRLIAATNCDLNAMMAEKRFRADLYYRLNVFPIRIPPLRERREDISLLLRYFVQKYARRTGKDIKTISGAAMQQLIRWRWPGNIRELENLVERAVILTHGTTLAISNTDFPENRGATAPTEVLAGSEEEDRVIRILGKLFERALMQGETLTAPLRRSPVTCVPETANDGASDKFDEKNTIIRVLRDTNGQVGGPDGAAARMGLKRTTLITRMKKLGIEPRRVF
jgi:formate hydrogenlyase transcriptional activator